MVGILLAAFLFLFFVKTKQPFNQGFNLKNNFSYNMFQLTSSAFSHEGSIPSKYTCDGKDINPSLNVSGVPNEAKSLVLVVEDPDAPGGSFYHWLVWNLSPKTIEIKEGRLPSDAVVGRNDFGRHDYGGPCPPQEHHYIFQLYALDQLLNLDVQANVDDLLYQIQEHAIAKTQLVGIYHRAKVF